MTLQEVALVVGITIPLLGGAGTGFKLYGDKHIWLASDTYNETELRKLQREKRLLEFDKESGAITPRGELELRELRDLEKQLLLQLQ